MKKTIFRILTLLYLGVLLTTIILIIKPGASIFYYKKEINNQAVVLDSGFAYRYHLDVDKRIFPPKGILLFENSEIIKLSNGKVVVNSGNGVFSISDLSQEELYLYFSSSDNSNPITNGRKYVVYFPIIFFSRTMGIIYLTFLLSLLVIYLAFLYLVPTHSKSFIRAYMLRGYHQIAVSITPSIKAYWHQLTWQVKSRIPTWVRMIIIAILIAYFYVFMEWLFFITKPSFMDIMNFADKLEIYLLTGFLLSIISIIFVISYVVLDIVFLAIHIAPFTRGLAGIIPTTIVTASALLLIDNFTYTIFKFGSNTTVGVWRLAYGLLFILLFVYFYSKIHVLINVNHDLFSKETPFKFLFFITTGLCVVSAVLAFTRYNFSYTRSIANENSQIKSKYPHILLLGSDGLNANNLSIYGYTRNTTPRIKELGSNSLIAENAFTNAAHSTGSVISILTGKLPTETRVLYTPDILTGVDAFEHLPGILKKEGYKTLEYGVPHYVDAYTLNLQFGFDISNNRSFWENSVSIFAQELGYGKVAYFISILSERIVSRILHISYIRDAQNPIDIVNQTASSINDEEKIDKLLEIVEQSADPVFIHAHLMGTHGNMFSPFRQIYSQGDTQDEPWMPDYYDDAIWSFDYLIGKAIDRLKEIGQFDNTILIIYSDHGMKYKVNERIPLIIHFPNGKFNGRITSNVQNLDIAPTILDYLGLPIPDWMDGVSILNGDFDRHRLIFSAGTNKAQQNEGNLFSLNQERIKPPFYQFSYINIVECHKWYSIDLSSLKWSSGNISGHKAPCNENSLRSLEEINEELAHHMISKGFIYSFPEPITAIMN